MKEETGMTSQDTGLTAPEDLQDGVRHLAVLLDKLEDTDDIDLLERLLLGDQAEDLGMAGPGPEKLATAMALTLDTAIRSFRAIEKRHRFGASVLLVSHLKLWGCKHHVKGGGYCKIVTGETLCFLEDLVVCRAYVPNYREPLFRDLRGSMVIGCLWCGRPFDKAMSRRSLRGLTDVMCIPCGIQLVNSLGRKIQSITSRVLTRRRLALNIATMPDVCELCADEAAAEAEAARGDPDPADAPSPALGDSGDSGA